MEDNKNLIVGGYLFQYSEDAELAKEERKKIKYLEKSIDLTVPDNVLSVYQKALDTKLFLTPVGWDYMMHLRKNLIELGKSKTDIPPIPLYMPFAPAVKEETTKQRLKSFGKKGAGNGLLERYRTRSRVMAALCIILAALVGGMFYIAMDSENPNILNYENAVINKYASWGQDLREREKAVREKEIQLNIDSEDKKEKED